MSIECLLITDSRGRNLEAPLKHYSSVLDVNVNFTVIVRSGARIVDLVSYSSEVLRRQSFDFVIFLGGVNNLSMKLKSGCISPIYTEVPLMVDNICDAMNWAFYSLKPLCKKLVMGQLIGLDFDAYNLYKTNTVTEYHEQQDDINQGVRYINHAVTLLNNDHSAVAPWIQDTRQHT